MLGWCSLLTILQRGRWRMHDLVRLYAGQLPEEHARADGREQARDRLLAHYLLLRSAQADGGVATRLTDRYRT
jgi:hypothetical protein